MKKRLNFHLTLTSENGAEKYLFQSNRDSLEFLLYNRRNSLDTWSRVYRPSSYVSFAEHWYRGAGTSLWVDTETAQPGGIRFYGEPGIGDIRIESAQVRATTSATAIRELQSREQLAQTYPSHRDHVRAHQEALVESMQLQAASEMARRAAQREAEQRRQEEERNRPRRPWDRVRNFFGQD